MNIRALICFLLLTVVVVSAQPSDPPDPVTIFYSQPTGGQWNDSNTWIIVDGSDDDGIPDEDDIVVITVSSSNTVTINVNAAVKDLYVVADVAGSISKGGFGTRVLTIHGQLMGTHPDLSGTPMEPVVDVFASSASTLNLVFTGSNLDDPFSGSVITSWGFASPIYWATFNPGSGNTLRVDNFASRSTLTVQSGTLQVNSGQQLQDFTGSSVLTVNNGATLNVLGSINGGSTSTQFGTVSVNGTLTLGTAGYVNSNTFNLGSSATLNIAFNGANQTQGWWYQSTEPTTLNLNPGSTVSYTANAAQNIYATTYGNLSLTSSSSVTKTLAGNGLAIAGNLMVGTNVTFAPSSEVEFTGTLAQSISGGGTLTFNGGLAVNKSSGTLTLSKNTSIAGLNVSAGILSLGNVTTTLSSGNVINDGTITSGTSGTLIVSGTSTFSGSGSLSLNNLTISGSTNINTNAWSITGNLVNNGSLTMPSTTTVTFTGGAAQSISGNAFEIGNMTVDKVSSTLSNNGNVTLLGVLTMTSGTFDADGSGSGEFILNSDPNGDARIGPMTGGNITGEVTFQRSFTNNSNRWRNLAFPVTDVTYAELSNSIELRTNSLATYTESVLGNVDQGWVFVSGGTLNSTRGHTAWMYDTGPITISVKGPLMQNVPSIGGSRYNFGVTYTNDPSQPPSENGWNFVPNPFASPINWNNGGWDKINVNAVAAIWDLESNTYLYSSGDEWDGVVAQGQAFWVQTNASDPVLRCSEDVKVSVSDPVFYKQAAEKSRLAVYLKSNQYTDKTVVQFREDATLEFDSQYDAYKLKNPIFNLSTLSGDGLSMAINNLPKGACPSLVKLNITNIEPGSYTLNFEGISGFEDVESVVLVDRFVDHQLTLSEGITYAFEVTGDEKSFGSSRFELHFNFANSEVEQPVITQQNGVLVSSYTEGSHQWFLDGTPIEGATQPTYRPTTRGAYTVEVSHKGCTLHSESILIAEETGSRAYPNPVSDELKVKVADLITDATDTGEIVFTSALGVPVKQVTFNKTDEIKVIDVRGIKPGQYFVSIIVNTQVVERFKIIVQ